ncbi:hypothetical protein Emin_0252 [Elusimicrobium minutum Pei191]|uniref:Uncharacterized protein n=1 Tax=Elusimicrobium minutum (strain Pei191) TaxID=445932 RepID=B2KB55_ELUMP|nr:hypothetical protein [Elusimicrobium minutum]ACC97814.1 hypothetical protein Emin_0252 [Elusimicrobium minutum Pei191]
MDNKDIIETEIIEAEVLDENGRPVNSKKTANTQTAKGVETILKAIVVLAAGFLMSVLIAVVFIILFIPVLILKALGLIKSDFQIRRFK